MGSFDYDMFSSLKPDGGNVATADGTFRSCLFVATLAVAVAQSAVSWTIEESEDGGTTWVAADPNSVIFRKPLDQTLTADAFHVGYIGKVGMARATLTGGASPAYTVIYGNPATGPVYGDSIVGIDA
jgi:hypothetical protein